MRRALGYRRLLWIPSLLVLGFFLFHVEVLGAVSHLFRQTDFAADRYEVALPSHWIVRATSPDVYHRPYFSAVAGKGLLRGWKVAGWSWWWAPYADIEGQWIEDDRESPDRHLHHFTDADLVATRQWQIPGGYVECGEYRDRLPRRTPPQTLSDRFIWADCFGKSEVSISTIHFSFVGTPEMLPEFYSFARDHLGVRQVR